MKFTTFSAGGHGTGGWFVSYDSGVPLPKGDATTSYASDLCDKEEHFLKWLFSKSK